MSKTTQKRSFYSSILEGAQDSKIHKEHTCHGKGGSISFKEALVCPPFNRKINFKNKTGKLVE